MKKILAFAKEYAGVLAVIISIISVFYTYTENKRLLETKFSVNCNLVHNGSISVIEHRNEIAVQFQTKCYVRNIGLRRADIVDARTALMYNGENSYISIDRPEWWESVSDLKINGNEFNSSFKIEPGSQATVDLKLNYLIDSSEMGKRVENIIRTCGIDKISSKISLEKCLRQDNISWTDYINSERNTWASFNGIGGSFQLSDGSFIIDEVSFKYDWLWSWKKEYNSLSDIPNLPKYMEEYFYRYLDDKRTGR